MNKYLRKTVKIILWVIASVLLLLVSIAIALNIPAVQNFVKDKAITYLKTKTKTEVSLESIRITFPKAVVLNEFYIADLSKDTLLYAEKLQVDISMLALLKNTVEINNLYLKNIRANVNRKNPDTTFNFSFLTDAFMGEQNKPKKEVDADTTSTLKFAIDKVTLEDIGVTYRDDVAGNVAKFHLGKLTTKLKNFDLKNQRYGIKNFAIKDTYLTYLQQKPLTELVQHLTNSVDSAQLEKGKLPYIVVDDFNFANVKVNYNDQLTNTNALVNVGILNLNNIAVDLTNNKYTIAKTILNNSLIKFAFKPAPSNNLNKVKDTVIAEKSSLSLAMASLNLHNNAVQFDNLSTRPLAKGIDFNHLNIANLSLGAKDLNFSDKGIFVNVTNGKLADKSGFILDALRGDVTYTDKQIKIKDLLLKTPHTTIQNSTNVTYTSLNDLQKNPEKVNIDLALSNTKIGLKDVSFFYAALPNSYKNQNFLVDAKVKVSLNNLYIDHFKLAGLQKTNINLTGRVLNATNTEKAFVDLAIKNATTSKKDLLAVLPKNTLPNNIELPNIIAVNGFARGGLADFNAKLNVGTDMGGAVLLASLKGKKGYEIYNANIKLNNFNVGRLLKQQPTLGKVSANASVVGFGLDPKRINASFKGFVNNAYYNKYVYKNLAIDGTYKANIVNVSAKMPDSNVNFNIVASANLKGKYPTLTAKAKLNKIDLQKLNFSSTELKIAGNIDADIKSANVDYLNGNIFATALQVVKDGKNIRLDTVKVIAQATASANSLILKSEVVSAKFEGKYQLTKIGSALTNQLNKYYAFGETKKTPAQRIKFSAAVHNAKLIQEFVPELTNFAPAKINGLLDTDKDNLILNANFPKVIYGNFNVDSATLAIANNGNELDYKLRVEEVTNPSLALYYTEISGSAKNNKIDANIFLRDKKRKDKYIIAGIFESINKDFRFRLSPERLILDYEKWNVAPENFLQFGKSGILANQFNISRADQLLSINSKEQVANAPLAVVFKDFKIETLMKFAETDSTLIGGEINGNIDVTDLVKSPKFTANIDIKKLRYQKDELGDLKALVNNNVENAFDVDVSLKGKHELYAKGFYYTNKDDALDFKINIAKIDLKEVESISMGQIKNGTGYVNGKFTINGPVSKPRILGGLKFDDAAFKVAYVNSYFSIPNQEIAFANEGIKFNDFTIVDSLGKKATINGLVNTTDFSNIRFGLDIRTNTFRLMNSTAEDNDMLYGTVFLTSNITVKGTLNQPDVNLRLNVEKGTKFFYAMPVNDPSVIEQEGIVEFIDVRAIESKMVATSKKDSTNTTQIKGMNLVADINIDPEAELNVVVDPANGDVLKIKGTADLVATIDPSGKISMTGRYEINEGSYAISIVPLGKKPFKLVKGSTIVWTGEPTEANVNLSALYEVNAAPIDLLNTPDDPTTKTKLPFQVYLNMKGELLKPIISFKIDLPENERGTAVGSQAYTKLQYVNRDENELNKQVFALLALERFITNNPFQSLAGGGGGINSMARSSVSKLLTEQLNNLAADLIQGVDVDFGVNSSEDYSSGSLQQKTDLEVGLSKKLLNDRLTVTVGSSFALEGPQAGNSNAANIAGNVNLDYALSKDGKYRLRAYRRNQTESVVEGQIIETGVGFTLVVDYNRFREIFLKKRNRNRINMEQKPKDEKAN